MLRVDAGIKGWACVGVGLLCIPGWVQEDMENKVFAVTADPPLPQNQLLLTEQGGPAGCIAAHH